MWKLVWSNLLRRPGRLFLTAAAVALSVALVVSTTTGYKSAEASLRQFVNLYLGASDFRVGSGVDPAGPAGVAVGRPARRPRRAGRLRPLRGRPPVPR